MTNPPHTYPHGVLCWIDIEKSDPDAAADFYRGLLGWDFHAATPPDAPDTYLIATLDGEDAAAIGGGEDGEWMTYVAVDDADAAAERVTDAGGTVLVPVADAGPGGRLAVCADPDGAVFRLWEADQRLGAQIANVPGAWNFSILRTADPEAALAFYARAFGWTSIGGDPALGDVMIAVPGYGEHLASTVDPGILERQEFAPEGFEDVVGGIARAEGGEPARWVVQFSIADRAEAIESARRGGGEVVSTRDTDYTFEAVLRDPQGAEFRVGQFREPEPAD
ncbi:MAG TPA: VOC family protein [Microbacterium sp.]|uniref:VOC family protein n=1 Tax=Microbacterium sp. TaxID=51671 RepID=UPI002B7CA01D|nr:VOC family protein [Microbacterium sp.]HWI31054.1 VOC family protein [Microbacterium sp.]